MKCCQKGPAENVILKNDLAPLCSIDPGDVTHHPWLSNFVTIQHSVGTDSTTEMAEPFEYFRESDRISVITVFENFWPL